jgi:hypothetical protein
MNEQEWSATIKQLEGTFDKPITDEKQVIYARYLADRPMSEVWDAIDRLVLSGQKFMPVAGEIVAAMQDPVPTFDAVWPKVYKVLTNASQYGEQGCIDKVRESCGELAAAWVTQQGAIRLSRSPIDDESFGGMLVNKLEKSWKEQTASPTARQQLRRELEGNTVAELQRLANRALARSAVSQLTLDGSKPGDRSPLTPAQREILRWLNEHGTITAVKAGEIVHSYRTPPKVGSPYASSDGSDALKRLVARGLVDRTARGVYRKVGR